MPTRLPSLRKAVWGKDVDGRDVGEAFRDLYTTVNSLTQTSVVSLDGVAWALPFHIQSDHVPAAVTLVRARPYQQPGVISPGAVDWTWINNEVRVDALSGLTIGTRYSLVFHLIG